MSRVDTSQKVAFGVPGGARVVRLDRLGAGPGSPGAVWDAIREPVGSSRLATHAAKDALLRLAAVDVAPGIAMDTEIAAYLTDPARGSYPLDDLVAIYRAAW